MAHTVTISPRPLQAGAQGTVDYNGKPGTVITLDFGEAGLFDVTIDANGQAVFDVPSGAADLIASDPDGNSDSTTVTP